MNGTPRTLNRILIGVLGVKLLAIGVLLILATLVAIVVVIGAVWTFVARRASRTPTRSPHRRDQGVRGS